MNLDLTVMVEAIADAVAKRLEVRGFAHRLLTIEETAAYLSLSKREVYNMIATGELRAVTHGRRKMLDSVDLHRWIERNKGLDNN
jgi:excisionase family DNA binding protein